MIDIYKLYEKYDDTFPVSFIVPLSIKRNDFFYNFVFPLLEANKPAEIIVNSNFGTAPIKRNEGFKKSTQPFVFFCDDDILLPANYIELLINLLKKNPDKAYAYTGYRGIVEFKENHPIGSNFSIPSVPFDAEKLRKGNFIATMSLIRRECLPKPKPFDENLKRLMDWDLYLTMLNDGHKGILLPNSKYYAYYLDEGITSNNNNEREGLMSVLQKHKLF